MIYILRYAEIALKGKNRNEFEKKLVENIKSLLKKEDPSGKIRRLQGRLILETEKEVDLRKVFGVISYSPCVHTEAQFKNISLEALKLAEKYKKTTAFRISAKRLTKDFSISSSELNNKVGSFVAEKTGFKVSLGNPDLDIGIEIMGAEAFVFEKTFACFGGLPVGIEGKVLVLISDQKSFLAALLMMKRGCAVELAGVSEQKSPLLQSFSVNPLFFHKIKEVCELYELADELNCKALVVNDTFKCLEEYPVDMLVLRPLISFSDEEIRSELEKYI